MTCDLYSCNHWIHNKCMKKWVKILESPSSPQPERFDSYMELPCGCRPPGNVGAEVLVKIMSKFKEETE
jgi:hypothetical protein